MQLHPWGPERGWSASLPHTRPGLGLERLLPTQLSPIAATLAASSVSNGVGQKRPRDPQEFKQCITHSPHVTMSLPPQLHDPSGMEQYTAQPVGLGFGPERPIATLSHISSAAPGNAQPVGSAPEPERPCDLWPFITSLTPFAAPCNAQPVGSAPEPERHCDLWPFIASSSQCIARPMNLGIKWNSRMGLSANRGPDLQQECPFQAVTS